MVILFFLYAILCSCCVANILEAQLKDLELSIALSSEKSPYLLLAAASKYLSGRSIVMSTRFYNDTKLSFALPASKGNHIRTLFLKPHHPQASSSVPMLAWHREPQQKMVLKKQAGFISSFSGLLELSREIVEDFKKDKLSGNLKAIRFHSNLKLCQLLSEFSNPPKLKVPIVLTTPLDWSFGTFSSDVPAKSCRIENYDPVNSLCRGQVSISTELGSCDRSDGMFKDFLTNYDDILLILTCQHHFISHPKLLSLPLGIRAGLELPIQRMYKQYKASNTKFYKTTLLSIYSDDFYYQNKVCI